MNQSAVAYLIVCYNNQLEVVLSGPAGDDARQGMGQPCLVRLVQVSGGLVQRQHPARHTEGFCQSEPNHHAGDDALAGGAAASHIQRRVSLAHDHAVVVAACGFGGALFYARHQLDALDVSSAIDQLPQFPDYLQHKAVGTVGGEQHSRDHIHTYIHSARTLLISSMRRA
jgi:hypothetical protein